MSLRRFRDISNQNFGLGDSKNNNLVRYNAPIERYTLESEDNILGSVKFLTVIYQMISSPRLKIKWTHKIGF